MIRRLTKGLLIKAAPKGLFSKLRSFDLMVSAWRLKVHEPDFELLPGIEPGSLIADIGANIGQSLIGLHKIFPGSVVHCFEPNPVCIGSLKRVRRILRNATVIHNAGVGSENGVLRFYVPNFNGVEFLQEGTFDRNSLEQVVAQNRIGCDFDVKEYSIDVLTIDSLGLDFKLLKIDVQGFEYEVIIGGIDMISRCRPVIIVENDSRSMDIIRQTLFPMGYKVIEGKTNSIFQVVA
jgi:FkbM family methyltransferase